MTPDLSRVYAVTEATWPAAARHVTRGFTLRDGAGGGKRVSAATALPGWNDADIPAAAKAMQAMGQDALFMVRMGEDVLDAALQAAGYDMIDPVHVRVGDIAALTDVTLPRVTAFAIWEPLAIMREIWAAGGIGPARINVMHRAVGPKTAIFGRAGDKPAGTGFCAIHDGIAMVHALEVAPAHRGHGLGTWMMRCAAHWAARHGATHMAALCTHANLGANALYASLGLQVVGDYHYRILNDKGASQ